MEFFTYTIKENPFKCCSFGASSFTSRDLAIGDFEGNFHNGKPDGKGIFFKKGSTYNAEFKDGHLKIHRKIILN